MKTLLFLLFISTQNLLALITITPVEIGQKTGFHTKVETSLETKRGSTDKENYKAGVRLSYDNDVNFVTWTEIFGEYGKSNKLRDTNKLYAHIRHIQAITDESFRAEIFGQVQNDEFKLIQERILVGVGLRVKLFDLLDIGNGYIGLGGMHEYINYTSKDPIENNIRVNSYIAYTTEFSNKSSLTYTFYYQPLIESLGDFVQSHKLQLTMNLYKNLFLNFKLSYDVDSKPPEGVEKEDFTQVTAFVFEF